MRWGDVCWISDGMPTSPPLLMSSNACLGGQLVTRPPLQHPPRPHPRLTLTPCPAASQPLSSAYRPLAHTHAHATPTSVSTALWQAPRAYPPATLPNDARLNIRGRCLVVFNLQVSCPLVVMIPTLTKLIIISHST